MLTFARENCIWKTILCEAYDLQLRAKNMGKIAQIKRKL